MKMRYNQGSHVGVMISFSIFMFFIIFLYVLLEPIAKTQVNPKSQINLVANSLINAISDDVYVTQIKIDNSPGTNCLDLTSDEGDALTKLGGPNIVIKDIKENNLLFNAFDPDGGNLALENPGDVSFISYYNLNNFIDKTNSTGLPGCGHINYLDDFHFEQTKTYRYAFENKISTWIGIYESNYADMKKNLSINEINDFNFKFTFANGTSIGPLEKNITADVYVNKYPVQYMDQNASIYLGYLEMSYW